MPFSTNKRTQIWRKMACGIPLHLVYVLSSRTYPLASLTRLAEGRLNNIFNPYCTVNTIRLRLLSLRDCLKRCAFIYSISATRRGRESLAETLGGSKACTMHALSSVRLLA